MSGHTPWPLLFKPKDKKFLDLCTEGARIFSTCGRTQFFAIITSTNGRVIGTGYNGVPPGMKHCVDGGCPRLHEDVPARSMYDNCFAVHAEENALIWSDASQRVDGTLYVNGVPCFGCAKKMACSGLKRVVHTTDDTIEDWPRTKAFMQEAGLFVVSLLRPVTPEPMEPVSWITQSS